MTDNEIFAAIADLDEQVEREVVRLATPCYLCRQLGCAGTCAQYIVPFHAEPLSAKTQLYVPDGVFPAIKKPAATKHLWQVCLGAGALGVVIYLAVKQAIG